MIDWDKFVITPLVRVFGEPFTWQLTGVPTFTADGVYDQGYREVSLAGGMEVITSGPAVGIRVADFPRLPRQNDRCTCVRTGEQFTVRKPQPDSHGHMLILLNAVNGRAVQ